MGEIKINLTSKDEPKDFKGKFNGKTFELRIPDTSLTEGTDNLKKPADWKDKNKFAVLFKTIKPFHELVSPIIELATVTGTVTDLGDHTLEIKFKGNKTYSATLKLLDKDGNVTRAIVEREAKNPTSVVLHNEGAAVHDSYQDTLDRLVGELKQTKNWIRNNMAWNPELSVKNHGMPGEDYWKAYIDADDVGGGTKWRLKFEFDYDMNRGIMTVTILGVDQDH